MILLLFNVSIWFLLHHCVICGSLGMLGSNFEMSGNTFAAE